MKRIVLAILSVSIFNEYLNPRTGETERGLFVSVQTQQSASNPSETGSFVFKNGQVKRLCDRVGVGSPYALKHLAEMGGATIAMDTEEVKKGQEWTNERTKQSGIYDKDFTRTSNQEISLGTKAKEKLVDASLAAEFSWEGIGMASVVVVDDPENPADAPADLNEGTEGAEAGESKAVVEKKD